MILGIDTSQYDTCPTTNWKLAYERGIRWASIRAATTGAGAKPKADPMHAVNMANALAAGILRMPYAWLDPRTNGVDQAACYLENRIKGELPDMLDLEDTSTIYAYGRNVVQKIRDWLDIVEAASDMTPIIYSSPSYIQQYLSRETWLSKYPLWIANYKTSAPYVPLPWSPDWWGWQYTMSADANYYGFNVPGFQIKTVALAIAKG